MLHQFGSGLETLDVLSAIRANPAAFEALFVASSLQLTPDSVKKAVSLQFSVTRCAEDKLNAILSMLYKSIDESNQKGMLQLFIYYNSNLGSGLWLA